MITKANKSIRLSPNNQTRGIGILAATILLPTVIEIIESSSPTNMATWNQTKDTSFTGMETSITKFVEPEESKILATAVMLENK